MKPQRYTIRRNINGQWSVYDRVLKITIGTYAHHRGAVRVMRQYNLQELHREKINS